MSEKKEYIERGTLIEKLYDDFHGAISDSTMYIYQIIRMLNEVPAADVEPVVRCKDCKWYETGVCDFLGAVTLDDDYCSIGARTERSGSGE